MRRRGLPLEPLPEPRAIDPRSGFNVPHSELVKEYRGDYVARRFADKPHPLDFPPPRIVERIALRNARPEPPEIGIAQPILWENYLPLIGEDGTTILGEGEVVSL
jgi:hypothetical protein